MKGLVLLLQYVFCLLLISSGCSYGAAKVTSVALGATVAGSVFWANNHVEDRVGIVHQGKLSALAAVGTGVLCWSKQKDLGAARYPLVLVSAMLGCDALRRLAVLQPYTQRRSFDHMLLASALFGWGCQINTSSETLLDANIKSIPFVGMFLREAIRYSRELRRLDSSQKGMIRENVGVDESYQQVLLAEGRTARVVFDLEGSTAIRGIVTDAQGNEICRTDKITFDAGGKNWVWPFIYTDNAKKLICGVVEGCSGDLSVILKRAWFTVQDGGKLAFLYEETLVGKPCISQSQPLKIEGFSGDLLKANLLAIGRVKYQFKRFNTHETSWLKLSDQKVVRILKKIIEKDELECGQFLCEIDGHVLQGGVEFTPSNQEHLIFLCERENKEGFWLATVNNDDGASKACFTRFDKDKDTYAHTNSKTFFVATIESVHPRAISGIFEKDGKLCVQANGKVVWSGTSC